MATWTDFGKYLYYSPSVRLMIDYGGMDMTDEFVCGMERRVASALDSMAALEAGAIANPDEGRMVGHYWLRAPEAAPTPELSDEISSCVRRIKEFAADIKASGKYTDAVVAGMGGSSLGIAFTYDALFSGDGLRLHFMDNTDPAGMDAVFAEIEPRLSSTMVIVISKSGGTVETRNSMEEARAFYTAHGVDFASHAVCITAVGSKLEAMAKREGWLASFPMWDWVGGRTSVLSAVGLLPMALCGIDTDEMLRGARECDALGRERSWRSNPAAITALAWYRATLGRGDKCMAILPYCDALSMISKYFQQLVMESLGKRYDLDGNEVRAGIAVFGNKGSSDQHSYVQQLVSGEANVFTTFVQVLRTRCGESITVGEDSTSGDYLNAFMLGTKKALEDNGKLTMTVTVPEVSAYTVGVLIALYERVVGIYACLINVNAYNQDAVEHGKKAAGSLIVLKNSIRKFLCENPARPMTAPEIAASVGAAGAEDDVFRLLLHLAKNDSSICAEYADDITATVFAGK